MKDIGDDEPICGCGLCRTVNVVFTVENYTNFLIYSSILELVYGCMYSDNMVYIFGYLNIVYVLRLFNYNLFSNILSIFLLPFYYKILFSQTYQKPNAFLECIASICVAIQILFAMLKTLIYVSNLVHVGDD